MTSAVDAAPVEPPWTEAWGQPEAVAQLRAAASDPAQLAHAWQIGRAHV